MYLFWLYHFDKYSFCSIFVDISNEDKYMKTGDKVRFLNEIGGGKIVGFQGKDIVVVEDADGFDIPMPMKDVIVVDSDDYNIPTELQKKERQRKNEEVASQKERQTAAPYRGKSNQTTQVDPQPKKARPDTLNVYLAFVPVNIKEISSTSFETYIVNDSSYRISYTYMSVENGLCIIRSRGEIEPDTKIFIEEFGKTDLNALERVAIQLIAYKDKKPFVLKQPVSVDLHIDTVKFYKLHSFQETDFFEEPTLLYDIVVNDKPNIKKPIDTDDMVAAMKQKKSIDTPTHKKVAADVEKNGILEIDLHADALLDTTAGMDNTAILNYQLETVRKTMDKYKSQRGKRIVFIHGKGEGVLRKAVLTEIKRKYPHCICQDASFQEYGFGATLVTVK